MKSVAIFSLRLVALFFVLLIVAACAKPNYQRIEPLNQTQVLPDEDKAKPTQPNPPTEPTTCALFLQTEQLCVQYHWTKKPTTEEMGEFELSFYKLERPDIKVAPQLKPFVKLWMAEHGHGSRPAVVVKTETGFYRVSKIFFSMPGKWQIRFQLLNSKNEVADQVIDETTF